MEKLDLASRADLGVAQVVLNAGGRSLTGRLLTQFVAAKDQARFRDLLRAAPDAMAQEHIMHFQTRQGEFWAGLSVTAVRDARGQISSLRWRLRDAPARAQDERPHVPLPEISTRQQTGSE